MKSSEAPTTTPDNVTYWHIIASQGDMKVCVKYFDNLYHRNPLNSHYLQTHFISTPYKKSKKIK